MKYFLSGKFLNISYLIYKYFFHFELRSDPEPDPEKKNFGSSSLILGYKGLFFKYKVVCPYFDESTPCPNFVILGLSTLQILLACCENNKLPFKSRKNFKTDIPFTIVTIWTCKNLYFVNDEVRAGCPKLGNTTLPNDPETIKLSDFRVLN